MSERVDWRFDQDRRRSSRSVLVAWPRPDVRRRCPRRSSKRQAKAQGRPSHPGVTGERQGGRVKNLNLRPMSRYGQLRRWDAVAEYRDWPLRSGRRRLGSPPSRDEHRRPRGTGGTHPARSSCARNVVTPVVVRAATSGKPTVRKAQLLGGNLMIEKRNAPRGALLYPRFSREELEGGFLGPMAYPDPQGERDSSMPGRAMVSPGVRAEVSRDPRDMAKAGSAPRGAKRKEMTDINISSVPAGMPALGCCSGLEKLGTAKARDRAPEVKRPDNVTAGRYCQTTACVLARPIGRAKANWW